MKSQKALITILAFTALSLVGACRRQVTVSPGPPNTGAANVPTPQQYHQDAGVTLAVPQTKFFKGSIGSTLGLQMRLTRDGDNLTGNYSYDKVGTKIDVKGTIDKDNNLTLDEFDSGGKQSGQFKGTWLSNADGTANLAGNWTKPGSDKRTAFSLHEEPIEFTAAVELVAKQIKDNNKKLNYQIEAAYPQATGSSDNNFEKFNQAARGVVTREIAEFKKQNTESTADAAAQPSPEDKSSTPGNTLDIGYDIALAKDDLISIRFEVGSYSAGAAHPNAVSTVLNYDVKGGKVLKLADLFNPGTKYLQALSVYCIKDLKSQSKSKGSLLDDSSIQMGAGPDLKNYSSWTITRKGLEITFDAYQVGAYAAGPQSVVVPYSVLKDLIRMDGPLMQFAK
jgi:hypothetical protein